MKVRIAEPHEYSRAGQLIVAAYRALPGAHLDAGYEAELADVERRAREAEVMVALVPDDGPVVGCVTLVPDASSPWAELLGPQEAGVRMLAVDPSAQGQGVGRALVQACVTRAKQLGRAAVLLHTTPWMTAAQRLYASLGFERSQDRDWYPVPEVPLLAYRYRID